MDLVDAAAEHYVLFFKMNNFQLQRPQIRHVKHQLLG